MVKRIPLYDNEGNQVLHTALIDKSFKVPGVLMIGNTPFVWSNSRQKFCESEMFQVQYYE